MSDVSEAVLMTAWSWVLPWTVQSKERLILSFGTGSGKRERAWSCDLRGMGGGGYNQGTHNGGSDWYRKRSYANLLSPFSRNHMLLTWVAVP